MSNLQNTINDERVWEHLEALYHNDEKFESKVCRAAEEDASDCDKNYYTNMCNEYLISLHEMIMDSCHGWTPYTIEQTKEIAEEILGGETTLK